MNYSAVVLAAGKGVRMCSNYPKVLHRVSGKPMLFHVIDALRKTGVKDINLVIGHGRELIREILKDEGLRFVVQEQQLGTGHALMQAEKNIAPDNIVVVLSGDTPLLQTDTIKKLLDFHVREKAAATVLSAHIDNPAGYGRIVRDLKGGLQCIVEEKDADQEQKRILEINSGIYCFLAGKVFPALKKLDNNNAQSEYYLTQVLEVLLDKGEKVAVLQSESAEDIYGINDRVQMAEAERIMRQRKNLALMMAGVTIIDPFSTFIDGQVKIGKDTIIHPFTMIEGETFIGENCEIGPATRISDSIIGNDVIIENSRINSSNIGHKCKIGPFAYLRPDTVLGSGVKVGDFVEIKKSTVGNHSKIPHLSYVGDAVIGTAVNIGAGTITCNYDGKSKHPTILEDGVFIGSNTNLVAPLKIGKNSMTGAGSTITHDVPPDTLAVERARQRNITRSVNGKSKDDSGR